MSEEASSVTPFALRARAFRAKNRTPSSESTPRITPMAIPAFAPDERPAGCDDGGGGEELFDCAGVVAADDGDDVDGVDDDDDDDIEEERMKRSGNSTTPTLFVQHVVDLPQHHRLLDGEPSQGVIAVPPKLSRASRHTSRQSGLVISLLVQKLSQ